MTTQLTQAQLDALFNEPAVRGTRMLRLGLVGPSGSGKTYTALRMARALADGGMIALLDTEHKTSQLYADEFTFYPVYMAAPYSPQRYLGVVEAAKAKGAPVLVIDSLSHAWAGAGGVLEQVDDAKAGNNKNTDQAWSKLSPIQQKLVEAMLSYPGHVIVTMRTKDAYGQDEKGKRVKVGLAPVQRKEVDYEFDVILYLDQQHRATVEKSRVSQVMPVNAEYQDPGEKEAKALADWLGSGKPVADPEPAPAAPPAPPAPPPAPTPPPAPPVPETPLQQPTTVTFYGGDGSTIEAPADQVEAYAAAGWSPVPPGSAPSAGAETPAPPATAPSSAPTAAQNGTSDSLIRPDQVQGISDLVGEIQALDPGNDWAAKVNGHLGVWFGNGVDSVDVTQLTAEQGGQCIDRLQQTKRAVKEKVGA